MMLQTGKAVRRAIVVTLLLATLWSVKPEAGATYHVDVVLPDAANLFTDGRVMIDGFDAGSIGAIELRDAQAIVRADIDDDHAPLPAGTRARIEYRALLGERVLVLEPPPDPDHETIPSGGLVIGAERTDLDQLLSALDAPTREHLASLVPQVAALLEGREPDLNAFLTTSGPALQALDEVLVAVAGDGPLLERLVDDLHTAAAAVATRRVGVAETVDGLATTIDALASERDALGTALTDLPGTAATAAATLDRVPATVEAVTPFLDDLRPVVDQLPELSSDLRPLLADLRPAISDLQPALAQLGVVLDRAPALLDRSAELLPTMDRGLESLLPAIDFLRPYAPELVGWLSNWGGASSNYDANGHYLRFNAKAGLTNLDVLPAELSRLPLSLPGLAVDARRAPGEIAGQPWTDANGDRLR